MFYLHEQEIFLSKNEKNFFQLRVRIKEKCPSF